MREEQSGARRCLHGLTSAIVLSSCRIDFRFQISTSASEVPIAFNLFVNYVSALRPSKNGMMSRAFKGWPRKIAWGD